MHVNILIQISFWRPFSSPLSFILAVLFAFAGIMLLTSTLYFIFHRLLKKQAAESDEDEPDDGEPEEVSPSYDSIHIVIFLFGVLTAITGYFFIRSCLHSIKVDVNGDWMRIISPRYYGVTLTADVLLSVGLMGVAWGWTRFFQILLLCDIYSRYEKLVRVIPWFSAFLILSFLAGSWFFFSNFFPLWWYFLSFGLIFTVIYFFSLKDFRRRIKMHLSRSIEYEEELSLSTISVIGSLVMIILIVLPHLLYGTLPHAYILAPFLFLWVHAMYMTPSKIFRQVKNFPRYNTVSSRLLNFTKYTRKYLLAWGVIVLLLAVFLGAGILFDPGFSDPYKNYKKCCENVKLIGQSLEQYMDENNGSLPDSAQWKGEIWLTRIENNKKLTHVPQCPSIGRQEQYLYRKWRNPARKNRPEFLIRCTGGAHKRVGVDGLFPAYDRFKGLIKNQNDYREKMER